MALYSANTQVILENILPYSDLFTRKDYNLKHKPAMLGLQWNAKLNKCLKRIFFSGQFHGHPFSSASAATDLLSFCLFRPLAGYAEAGWWFICLRCREWSSVHFGTGRTISNLNKFILRFHTLLSVWKIDSLCPSSLGLPCNISSFRPKKNCWELLVYKKKKEAHLNFSEEDTRFRFHPVNSW